MPDHPLTTAERGYGRMILRNLVLDYVRRGRSDKTPAARAVSTEDFVRALQENGLRPETAAAVVASIKSQDVKVETLLDDDEWQALIRPSLARLNRASDE